MKTVRQKKQYIKVLPNGSILLFESCPGFVGAAVGVWVQAGSRDDLSGKAGIAHFFEHMMFKGTKTRTALQLSKEVDRVGGDFNAFTSRENTCFQISLLGRDLDLAYKILADVCFESKYSPDEIEREKKVILEEIQMVEDSPEEMAHESLYRILFGRTGLGQPIIGSRSSVKSIKRADLLKFYKKYYRPEDLIISVAADADFSVVSRQVSKHFDRKNSGSSSVQPQEGLSRYKLSDEDAHRLRNKCSIIYSEVLDSPQTHLLFAMPIFYGPGHQEDSPRYWIQWSLFNLFMGGGSSSKLFQEVREKRALAYTVYSSVTGYQDVGLFSVYLGVSSDKVAKALKSLRDVFVGVAETGVTEQEFTDLKLQIRGSFLLSLDQVESAMMTIAQSLMSYGRLVSPAEILETIDGLSYDTFQKFVKKTSSQFLTNSAGLIYGAKQSKKQLEGLNGGFFDKKLK